MNTAVRSYSQGMAPIQTSNFAAMFTLSNLVAMVLAIAILLTAFGVVYMKDLNRRLFIQYQSQQHLSQSKEVEWGKLLLEESTLSSQSRVQQIAQKKLNMVIPGPNDIVMVELK